GGGGLAGNGYRAHARGVQVFLDRGLAVAAVGGDRAGHLAGPAADAFDGRHELRAVGGGAAFHAVVHDDAVVVVQHLGLIPELDRPVDAALADRPGIGV